MMRIAVAGIAVWLSGNLVFGDEFSATLRKVEPGKVTFVKMGTKPKKQASIEMPLAAKVKVVTGNYNKETRRIEPGEEIPGGFANELFKKLESEPLGARIITDAEGKAIIEVRVFQIADKKKPK